MTVRLDGKVALISGVSDGIGGAIARCFASGRTAIQTAVSDFGGFDVLVNNAGLLLLASTAATNHVAYGSSKAAVSGITRHAASECAANNSGIRVNAICPGVVRTAMLVNTPENRASVSEKHPLGIGEPADVASAALYLASDESRWVTGAELTVDGGYSIRP